MIENDQGRFYSRAKPWPPDYKSFFLLLCDNFDIFLMASISTSQNARIPTVGGGVVKCNIGFSPLTVLAF